MSWLSKDLAPKQSEQFLVINVHEENKTDTYIAARPTSHLMFPINCAINS